MEKELGSAVRARGSRQNKANFRMAGRWKKSGSRRPTLDQAEGRLYEEPPSGAPAEPGAQTKPICPATVTSAASRQSFGETKPIPIWKGRGAGRQDSRSCRAGQSCETKPICPRRPPQKCRPAGPRQNKANFRPSSRLDGLGVRPRMATAHRGICVTKSLGVGVVLGVAASSPLDLGMVRSPFVVCS